MIASFCCCPPVLDVVSQNIICYTAFCHRIPVSGGVHVIFRLSNVYSDFTLEEGYEDMIVKDMGVMPYDLYDIYSLFDAWVLPLINSSDVPSSLPVGLVKYTYLDGFPRDCFIEYSNPSVSGGGGSYTKSFNQKRTYYGEGSCCAEV